jgi:hypothetical protein
VLYKNINTTVAGEQLDPGQIAARSKQKNEQLTGPEGPLTKVFAPSAYGIEN